MNLSVKELLLKKEYEPLDETTGKLKTNPIYGWGRYFMREGFWYYFPIIAIDEKTFAPTYPPQPSAICLAPLNSLCIFRKSQLDYGGETMEDDYISR